MQSPTHASTVETIVRAVALASILVLVGLRAVAYATPPDPIWIAGIYDAADLDSQVEVLRHASGVPDAARPPELAPTRRAVDPVLLPPDPSGLPSTALGIVASRAPPAR